MLYSIVTSTRTSPLLFFWWFAFFWKILFFQTFIIMVGSCSWAMWIYRLRWGDKIVVVKMPVTDHKRSSQKSERIALFEKPQVLQKHRHACISVLGNLSVVHHYTEALNPLKYDGLPGFLYFSIHYYWLKQFDVSWGKNKPLMIILL